MPATVLGLGDILSGDLGAGCCVLEMLAQETRGMDVTLYYLARDAHHAGAFVFGHDPAAVVMALPLGGQPGSIYCWDLAAFRKNIDHYACRHDSLQQLACSLGRSDLAYGLPEDMLFVWIEPERTEGVGLSTSGRRAARQAAQLVRRWLREREVLPGDLPNVRALYRFDFCSPAAA